MHKDKNSIPELFDKVVIFFIYGALAGFLTLFSISYLSVLVVKLISR